MAKTNGNNRLAHGGRHAGAPISDMDATACTANVRYSRVRGL
jgi:hypothetical protein